MLALANEFSDQIRVCPPADCVLSVTVPHLDSLQGKKEREGRKKEKQSDFFSRILTIPGAADVWIIKVHVCVCYSEKRIRFLFRKRLFATLLVSCSEVLHS